MKKIINFFKTQLVKYKFALGAVTLLALISGLMTYYPEKTYFKCKVELKDDWYKVYVVVNKYYWGYKYTLNNYKMSQCTYIENSDTDSLDTVFCTDKYPNGKDNNLSFNIVDGSIDSLHDSFPSSPLIALDTQECKRIEKAVN